MSASTKDLSNEAGRRPTPCCTVYSDPVCPVRTHLVEWYGGPWIMCDLHYNMVLGVYWHDLVSRA